MKSADDAVQDETHTRSVSLDSLRTQRKKKRLDAPPFQRAGNRLGEDGDKGLAVAVVHGRKNNRERARVQSDFDSLFMAVSGG